MNESSIIAIGSATYRQNEGDNEDYIRKVVNEKLGIRGVIVGDGIGSQAYAGLASRWAVESAADLVASASEFSEQKFQAIFLETRGSVKKKAARFLAEGDITVDENQSFGTTLIIAIEDTDSFLIGYVGNGAIWHIRGNFNHFSTNQYFPWNALNYLNPHTVQNKQGKESLYRMISISNSDEESFPTVFKINKDLFFGDILLICTDGIASNDQVSVGRMKDNTVWLKAEPSLIRLLTMLNNFFSSYNEITEEGLSLLLHDYLLQSKITNLLDDDASIGLIITNTALDYQSKK